MKLSLHWSPKIAKNTFIKNQFMSLSSMLEPSKAKLLIEEWSRFQSKKHFIDYWQLTPLKFENMQLKYRIYNSPQIQLNMFLSQYTDKTSFFKICSGVDLEPKEIL